MDIQNNNGMSLVSKSVTITTNELICLKELSDKLATIDLETINRNKFTSNSINDMQTSIDNAKAFISNLTLGIKSHLEVSNDLFLSQFDWNALTTTEDNSSDKSALDKL